MRKSLFYASLAGLVLFAWMSPSVAQKKDDDADAKKKREEVFGKSFEEQVEEAVDKGCEALKKLQGIDKKEDPAIFGQMKEAPLYGAGEPHQYRIGRTAFPVQALCKSGVFHDEPEVEKAMAWLRKNYRKEGAIDSLQGNVPSMTYEDACVLCAIEAYYISAWEAKDRKLDNPKNRFEKDADGKKVPIKRWGTEEKGAKKAKEKKKNRDFKLSRDDQRMAELAVKALEARCRKAYGAKGWRYQPTGRGENQPDVDISATQYALLGFKCASRLGLRYDKSILMDTYHLFRMWQDADGPEVVRKKKDAEGKDVEDKEEPKRDAKKEDRSTRRYEPKAKDRARGWSYCRKDAHGEGDLATYGSMTAAALCGLVILRDELENDPAMQKRWKPVENECDQMLSDGMAWMVMNWAMDHNPKRGMHRYFYYLYTVERLGMLGGLDYIGAHDWYFQGAKILLEQQTPGGAWAEGNEIPPSDLWNTCYALLFLKRAEEGIDRPKPVFTGGDYDD